MKRCVVLFGAILCVTVAGMSRTGLSQRRGYRTGSRPPQVREQERQLAAAQRELRAIVTTQQEAKLILMGYLD